jgi:excinuclease ABC subunit A
MIRDQKGEYRRLLEQVKSSGYSRVRLDGEMMSLEDALKESLDKQKKHTIEVVIDRLDIDETEDTAKRLAASLETALDLANGSVIVSLPSEDKENVMSQSFACPVDGISLPPIEPRNFSFNSPHGACPECTGLGSKLEVDPELVIPNKNLTLAEGAIRPWSRTATNQSWYFRILAAVAKRHKFSISVPVKQLTKKQLDVILYGTGEEVYKMELAGERFSGDFNSTFEGVVNNLERRYRETDSDYIRGEIEHYMRVYDCPSCHGRRLKPEVLSITLDDKNIATVSDMTIEEAQTFFLELEKKLSKREMPLPLPVPEQVLSSNKQTLPPTCCTQKLHGYSTTPLKKKRWKKRRSSLTEPTLTNC